MLSEIRISNALKEQKKCTRKGKAKKQKFRNKKSIWERYSLLIKLQNSNKSMFIQIQEIEAIWIFHYKNLQSQEWNQSQNPMRKNWKTQTWTIIKGSSEDCLKKQKNPTVSQTVRFRFPSAVARNWLSSKCICTSGLWKTTKHT